MKNNFIKSLAVGVIILIIGLGTSIAVSAQVHEAADTTYVIYSDDLQGWGLFNPSGSGTIRFMPGPGTPPVGTGSIRLQTIGAAESYILFKSDWGGIQFSDITSLTYSTYLDPSSLGSAL
jgi:hypothetical protein